MYRKNWVSVPSFSLQSMSQAMNPPRTLCFLPLVLNTFKFSCDELSDADDDNDVLSAHVSEEDYEQDDDSYDDFDLL